MAEAMLPFTVNFKVSARTLTGALNAHNKAAVPLLSFRICLWFESKISEKKKKSWLLLKEQKYVEFSKLWFLWCCCSQVPGSVVGLGRVFLG